MAETLVDTELPAQILDEITQDVSNLLNTDPTPSPDSDLYKALKVDELTLTDVGPSETIDVQPDFREITIQLIDHCTRIYDQVQQLQIPGVTPATLLAAMLQSIYGYGALVDLWSVRQYTSQYGAKFLTHTYSEQYLTLISWNIIPPCVREIIRGLQFTFDPRRKNIAFMFSFACYSFDHDFGRAYPVHMFIMLHNIIATSLPTATSDEIWREWLNSTVIRNNDSEIKVANIIGGAYDQHLVENYMTRKLRLLLAPVSLQNNRRRRIFKEFPIPPYLMTARLSQINPYYYLLGGHNTIAPSMMNFTQEFHNKQKQIFEGSKILGELIGLESGTQIMNHYYIEAQLPTYHDLDTEVTKTSTTQTLANFATRLKFKCSTRCSEESKTPVNKPPATVEYTKALYLVNQNGVQPPDPNTRMVYESKKHSNERILLYSPWSTGVSSLYYPVTTGILIETNEIDGIHIPFPRNDTSIHDENSFFLESAIPMESTLCRNHLQGDTNISIRYRVEDNIDVTKVSLSFDDRTKHILPIYAQTVQSTIETQLLPGFTLQTGITDPHYATNKIAYDGNRKWTKQECDSVFPDPPIVWSSYRWIDRKYAATTYSHQYTYFLINFRTMYGTMPSIYMSNPLHNIIKDK